VQDPRRLLGCLRQPGTEDRARTSAGRADRPPPIEFAERYVATYLAAIKALLSDRKGLTAYLKVPSRA
jgi:hypothetical protein